MEYLYYLVAISIFFAIVLFLEGVFYFWNTYNAPEVKRVSHRVQGFIAKAGISAPTIIKERLLARSPNVERVLLRIPYIHLLDRFIYQSGINFTVSSFLGISFIVAVGGMILLLVLGLSAIIAIGIGIMAGLVPYMYMRHAKQKRLIKIEETLPDALDLMGRALKAGHAFPGALQMVGDEMTGPIAAEFKIVFDEINYGLSIQEAMDSLITRVPSTDLSYFAIAVLIQAENGGNLSELLSNISALIRARLKLLGTVRVLSAEGRMSAWILTLLPFILGFLLLLINPNFFNILLTDPAGIKIISVALVLMLFGIFWMSKIVKIRT